ncbi:hypothetical protein PAECIP111891_00592 [Paenibacillus allorhizoplanae]|uniref:SLH domain-containing protein n=1 Tax=Paenibacillus allorhizoplanae TaxID=2905648 RepID=A0ABM9BWV6_9BACL|nr:hypothetical protein [Paenibacillus allorhizoplanae]CAH1195072.1 hypothetical protein PAECIP111891_00592 [Paenibacillus allorhizoplanae]
MRISSVGPFIKKGTILSVILLLMVPIFSHAAEAHWVEPEQKSYKQQIVPYKDGSSMNGPVTREEWNSFYFYVLHPARYDEPIDIGNWATMIKMGVQLPKGKEDDLIKGYVYDLVPMYAQHVNRETAVGGLIKLLSFSLVQGSGNNKQLDARQDFLDFKDIREMHQGLVQTAYQDGLLDSVTTTNFRPKDNLTNAEAISIMAKVMKKYEQEASKITPPTQPGFPSVVTLFENTPMYSSKDASQGMNGMISPQHVRILAVQEDWLTYSNVTDTKWFQVATWLGPQWIQLELQQVGNFEQVDTNLLLQQSTSLQDSPHPDSTLSFALSPQKVHVIGFFRSKFAESFLIETWVGPRWISNPHGATQNK